MDNIHHILKTQFGFDSFREGQEPIIRAMVQGRDVFAVLPTGRGKSLCYMLPAVVRKGVTVVITPLISLMQDQVRAARDKGLVAAYINHTMSEAQVEAVYSLASRDILHLLYVAPERFVSEKFQRILREIDCTGIVLDEAHCVSRWGHDFREAYLRAADLVGTLGLPVAAFTASVTIRTQQEIIERLKLKSPYVVRASFNRDNLRYVIEKKEADENRQILDYIRSKPGQHGIVYRLSRASVEATALYLRARGVEARPYHARIKDNLKERYQTQFLMGTTPVIVATIAFGMGIDKPNIRWVLHADLPSTMEGYYQETGRAGRDGQQSVCTLLYSIGDSASLRSMAMSCKDEDERKRKLDDIETMIRFASGDVCRRKAMLAYFDEQFTASNCGMCDVCDSGYKERRFEFQRMVKSLFGGKAA